MAKHFGVRVGMTLASMALAAGVVAWPAGAAETKTPSGAATAKKVTPGKPATIDPKVMALLKPSIDALTKEAKNGMKDGKNTGLREKSDYFSGDTKVPDGVTPDVILATLETQVNNMPPIDAYVKWQLMSGLPATLTEEQLPRLYNAYRRAPELAANPGLRHQELQAALFKAGASNPKNDIVVNKDFDAQLDRFNAANTYIIEYRNALYARLPATQFESVAGGLEDLFSRVQHGLEVKPFWEKVETHIRTWSATASGPQVQQMIAALTKLDSLLKDLTNKPYTHVIQSKDPKKMGLVWDDKTVINLRYLDGLITDLKDAIRPTSGANPTAKMK